MFTTSQAQPLPNRPRGRLGELILELIETAKGRVDGISHFALGLSAATLLHDLPEHGVVGMPAAIVADGRLDRIGHAIDVLHQIFDAHIRQVRMTLERGVDVVHVGAVVLVVVNLHRTRVDMRLERVERIRKWGQLIGHRKSLLAGTAAAQPALLPASVTSTVFQRVKHDGGPRFSSTVIITHPTPELTFCLKVKMT